jgi:PPOX class probable F420-dependent enzyme
MATPLDAASYINLKSFRRDGSAVDTPVWLAPLDGKLMVFTLGDSYKVKRIRRNPRVRVARCDVRGKLLGPWYDGRCRAVEGEPELEKRTYAALRAKYGWQMYLGDFFSRLSGRYKKRLVLEITLDAEEGKADE